MPTNPTPADLAAFDVDAFIAGITLPVEVVPIAQDGNLGQQLREAADAITAAEKAAEDAAVEGQSSRRAASKEPVEVEHARAAYDTLMRQARESGKLVWVAVQAETKATRKQALKDARAAGGDLDVFNTSLIAQTSRLHLTDPRIDTDSTGQILTREQWDAFSTAIGASQWDALIDAAQKTAAESVTPDFSRPASPSPDGDASSRS